MGIAPPIDASNPIESPFSSTASKISSPCLANKALLAVTTCLLFFRAFKMKVLAGS